MTFTCVNSGTTSGTLSYFPSGSNYLFSLATAANNILIQRCFVPHTNINLFIADNSVKNVRIDNVIGDYLNVFLTAALNLTIRSVSGSPSLAAQTSVYGTHRLDAFNADVTTNLTGLSWSRTTTLCTVTCADHKLRTGLFINVVASDNIAGIPLGTKTVTVIDSSTFTFACVNSGSTSGVLDIRTVIDRIALLMNETTSDTADQVSNITGTAAFTSAGGLVLPTIGDSITFESPTYRFGFTGFSAAPVVMGGAVITNFKIDYQIDKNDGSGYGGWHNMHYLRAGGSGVNGANTFTVTDATGVEVDDYVSGTNIGGLAKVTDVTGNTITVDTPNIGTVSGNIIFYAHQRNEVLSGLGFKFKIKITSINTYATAITSLSIYADSDDTSRAKLYPLDTVNVQLSGFTVGTRIQIYDLDNNIELYNDTPSSSPLIEAIEYTEDINVRIRAMYSDPISANKFVEFTDVIRSTGLIRSIDEVVDSVYVLNAVDGSTVTSVEIDDSNLLVKIDASTITWADIYAYESYWLTTEIGIRDRGRFINAVDQANYTVTDFKIKNITFPSIPLEITGGYGIDSVTGKSITLVDNTGGTIFNSPDHVVPYSTSGGGGSGGDTKEDVYSYFTSSGRQNTFKADLTGIAMSSDVTSAQSSIIAEVNANEVKIDLIKTKTDSLVNTNLTGIATSIDVSNSQTAIISEINSNESKIDIIDNNVDAIKAKTDVLINTDLSSLESDLLIINEGIKKASILVPHTTNL